MIPNKLPKTFEQWYCDNYGNGKYPNSKHLFNCWVKDYRSEYALYLLKFTNMKAENETT